MNTNEIQRTAREGFELWRYGKRIAAMENLCLAYKAITGETITDEKETETGQQLLQGIERYFRILMRGEAIPASELAEIEAAMELHLGTAHEKTVSLCRRIAELCEDPADKQRWYEVAYKNSDGGDLDSRDALLKLRGEMKAPVKPQPYVAPEEEPVQGNSILLMDGRLLECLPKEESADNPIDNGMRLDTTGVYLVTDNKKRHPKTADEPHSDRVAFLQNAFLLFENAETILNDSRMYLAHVPIQSGLAYTGISGFRYPTLGVYIEFWQRSEMPMTIKKGIYPFAKEHKTLLYHLAGSPLSGGNHCSFVTPDGTTLQHSVSPFIAYWPLFQKINSRYDEAKVRFQAYTIREVVDILNK